MEILNIPTAEFRIFLIVLLRVSSLLFLFPFFGTPQAFGNYLAQYGLRRSSRIQNLEKSNKRTLFVFRELLQHGIQGIIPWPPEAD